MKGIRVAVYLIHIGNVKIENYAFIESVSQINNCKI